MKKKAVNNISAVGIIVRAKNPKQIFMEIKDDGFPLKVFRRGLCPIGGNWIGERGKYDQSPLDTFRREVKEELSLEKSVAFTLELSLLGIKPEVSFYRPSVASRSPTKDGTQILDDLKEDIVGNCTPFGDYIITIPKAVLDRDPENQHDGYSFLVSYWLIVLNEKQWEQLTILQNEFGNLSNESITVITSLDEIVNTGMKFAFGHDRPIKDFFLSYGFQLARQLPIVDGISCREVGKTMAFYQDYLKKYEVLRKPI